MKKFIVDTGDKKYKVEANTYDEAVSAVKAIQAKKAIKDAYVYRIKNSKGEYEAIKTLTRIEIGTIIEWKNDKWTVTNFLRNDAITDEASPLQTVNALLEDERAAVDAYNVALENLKGKIPEESYAAIEAIRNDENRHIENLQAVVNGTVTEKNLEDSVKDDYFWSEIKPGEHVYIEYRDAGRRLATLPNKTVFKGREGSMIVVNMNGKELRIPENAIAIRTKDSVKDIDVEYVAVLAEDFASLLRRNKIEQAKRVLQLLITAMR